MLRPPAQAYLPLIKCDSDVHGQLASMNALIILTSLTFYQAGKDPNPAREIRSGFSVPMHQPVLPRQVYVKSNTID